MLPETAETANAVRNVENIACPITIAVGGEETPGFLWQHEAFKSLCNQAGRAVKELVSAGDNHFSVTRAFTLCAVEERTL